MRISRAFVLAVACVFALAGCQNLTQQQQAEIGGTILGAGVGLILADAFDANPAWTVGTALAGAAIGQQVARNNSTGECAYFAGRNSFGQPVYRIAPC